MRKPSATIELRNSILLLELKQSEDAFLLKKEILKTYENLKPVNLIKNAFNKFVEAPDFKTNLLNATLSLASGYLAKKITIGSTHNPIKQLLGTVLQMGVTSLVSKNSSDIKSTIANLFTKFLHKKTANPNDL